MLGVCLYVPYHSLFIPGGVAEASQVILRDAHVFKNNLAVRNTTDVTGVSAINPLVAFNVFHECL
jgi:hypothetical protein